ncbi:MAG: M18 family aminopeptidase, partial [Gammaproteobacteria bacterium]|nr:M18 family aminopeptidase [Gammaproteobacteria bacterium]
MQDVEFVNGLIDFIKSSPTPFHAVESMSQILEQHGFKQLDEADPWEISNGQPEGRYYVTRNDSSIIAFQLNNSLVENG